MPDGSNNCRWRQQEKIETAKKRVCQILTASYFLIGLNNNLKINIINNLHSE
jgi:hypothetical protein